MKSYIYYRDGGMAEFDVEKMSEFSVSSKCLFCRLKIKSLNDIFLIPNFVSLYSYCSLKKLNYNELKKIKNYWRNN